DGRDGAAVDDARRLLRGRALRLRLHRQRVGVRLLDRGGRLRTTIGGGDRERCRLGLSRRDLGACGRLEVSRRRRGGDIRGGLRIDGRRDVGGGRRVFLGARDGRGR